MMALATAFVWVLCTLLAISLVLYLYGKYLLIQQIMIGRRITKLRELSEQIANAGPDASDELKAKLNKELKKLGINIKI